MRLDSEINDELIRDNNLILWGDPGSNRVLARIADKLPIHWTGAGITVGKETFPAATHALIAIYPNPLNSSRYVVLNSGPTQREFDYLNNARQVPKLPDYAVVDLATQPGPRWAGRIALAGFFGERWQLLETHGK